ncbi:hypothetical protein ACFSKU_07180 [Pontibacter silvestris]|uniref:Uncharacterized protein n=1 Tax=Pontibacter silvestris TaxID=2305183 RepID=A0ABW4WVA2_9BACT|nr:hypothetical protein [Pontibacter silvestris]MCC9136573.1 hypothetical protein [Pontibacter silvestris]
MLQAIDDLTLDFPNLNHYFAKVDDWVHMGHKSGKSIFAGHYKKKVYKTNNNCLLRFDAFPYNPKAATFTFTHIVNLNLQAEQASYQTFYFPKAATEYNSYLLQNKLLKFPVSSKELKLETYDAYGWWHILYTSWLSNCTYHFDAHGRL